MSFRKKFLMGLMAVGFAGIASQPANAFIFFPIPFFTKIAECGTVTIVNQTMPFPIGDPEGGCLAWEADSGGVYLVGGIEDLAPGDRVFVEGDICNTCLTTCAAGAIANAELSGCQ